MQLMEGTMTLVGDGNRYSTIGGFQNNGEIYTLTVEIEITRLYEYDACVAMLN